MIEGFIKKFSILFKTDAELMPWEIINNLSEILMRLISLAGEEYHADNGVLIHKSAVIEQNVILKSPVIITAQEWILTFR